MEVRREQITKTFRRKKRNEDRYHYGFCIRRFCLERPNSDRIHNLSISCCGSAIVVNCQFIGAVKVNIGGIRRRHPRDDGRTTQGDAFRGKCGYPHKSPIGMRDGFRTTGNHAGNWTTCRGRSGTEDRFAGCRRPLVSCLVWMTCSHSEI